MNSRPSGSGIYEANGCLIVPIRDKVDDGLWKSIGKQILDRLKELGPRGVLIDVSGVSIMGSYGFRLLKNTARAITMMGSKVVLVGIQPGVASSLVDLDIDLNGIQTAVNTEDALKILENKTADQMQEDSNTDEDQSSDVDDDDDDDDDGDIKAKQIKIKKDE